MGRRDYRHREAKKPKRGAKKTKQISEFTPQVEVEVVKRRKRETSAEE
jgi:hypothetical protein